MKLAIIVLGEMLPTFRQYQIKLKVNLAQSDEQKIEQQDTKKSR
jgi:hypothetical protein